MKLQSSIQLCLFLLGLIPGLAHSASPTDIDEVFEPSGQFDPKVYGKVAVVQWAPSTPTPINVSVERAEAFKQENRKVLEAYIREAAAKGAKMVITPEFAIVGYPDIPELPSEDDNFRNREDVKPYVETVPGPSTNYFSALAKELGIYIHIGFAEVDATTDEYHNAVVALDPQGNIVASYRKMSTYGIENRYLVPGNAPSTYDSIFGKIGIVICSDIYHSNPMDYYRELPVNALAMSTSWAQRDGGMRAFQAGAQRARAYVLAANQNYFPDSGVINPDGSKQSHIRQSDGVAYGYLPYKR